jgi:ethanolamine-phosphate cytidylyltransferase
LWCVDFRLGDYVIVGVHNDSVVNQRRGMNLPIMNMHERVLSVLGCKVRACVCI